jgi:hypothetical protein
LQSKIETHRIFATYDTDGLSMNKLEKPLAIYTFRDRREQTRRDVDWPAKIRLHDVGLVPCRVLNVSASGALVEVAGSVPLPDAFNLLIEAHDFEAACEVRHRTAGRIGVMFMSSRRDALVKFG